MAHVITSSRSFMFPLFSLFFPQAHKDDAEVTQVDAIVKIHHMFWKPLHWFLRATGQYAQQLSRAESFFLLCGSGSKFNLFSWWIHYLYIPGNLPHKHPSKSQKQKLKKCLRELFPSPLFPWWSHLVPWFSLYEWVSIYTLILTSLWIYTNLKKKSLYIKHWKLNIKTKTVGLLLNQNMFFPFQCYL